MTDDKSREVPAEGSNHIDHESGQARSNVSNVLSNPYRHQSHDAETDLPSDVEPKDGEVAPAEKNTPDDSEIEAGEMIERDEVLTPESDPEDIEDSDETTGKAYKGAADEQDTEYKRSI